MPAVPNRLQKNKQLVTPLAGCDCLSNSYRSGQWRSQNEAEEALAPSETNLLRFLLVLCINFQLLEKRQ